MLEDEHEEYEVSMLEIANLQDTENLEKWYLLVEQGPEGVIKVFGIYTSEEELVHNAKRLVNVLIEIQPLVDEVDTILEQEAFWTDLGLREVFEDRVKAIEERLSLEGVPFDYASLPRIGDIAVLVLVREGESPFLRLLHEQSFFVLGDES